MTTLEELAAALYGDAAQAEIKASNPYYKYQSVPQEIGGAALSLYQKDPSSISQGKAIGYNALGSLLSGILTGAGDSYQQTLTNRYMDTVTNSMLGKSTEGSGLPANLFGKADQTAKLFKLKQMAETKQAEQKNAAERDKTIGLEAIKNPQAVKRALQDPEIRSLWGLPPLEAAAEPIAVKVQTPEESRGVEGIMLDDIARETQRLMDQGIGQEQATKTAREAYDSKRSSLDRQYKRIEEAEKAGADMAALTAELRVASQNAGNTGWGGNIAQTLAGIAGMVSPSQNDKYSAGQTLESKRNDIIGIKGRAFKGPMSDADVRIMLSGMPGLDKDEKANSQILDSWDYAAHLQKTYAEFMRGQQEKSVPVAKAETAWTKIKEANPYVLKDEQGKYAINPKWLGGESPELLTIDAPKKTSGTTGTTKAATSPDGLRLVPGKTTKDGRKVYTDGKKLYAE
jgi:hypothetical protein